MDEVVERFEEDNQSEQDDPNLYIKLDGIRKLWIALEINHYCFDIVYNEDWIAKTPFENVNDRHHRNEAIKIHNRYQKGHVEEGFTQSNSNLAIFVSKQDDSYINEEWISPHQESKHENKNTENVVLQPHSRNKHTFEFSINNDQDEDDDHLVNLDEDIEVIQEKRRNNQFSPTKGMNRYKLTL